MYWQQPQLIYRNALHLMVVSGLTYVKIFVLFEEYECLCYSNTQKQPPEVFPKDFTKFKDSTKFTGKHLCLGFFFNKVAGLRPVNLLKKTLAQVFSREFYKTFRGAFITEHLRITASEITCSKLTLY